MNIEAALYNNFIKYDRLYNLTMQAFYGQPNVSEINIYIDMTSMINILYNNRYYQGSESFVPNPQLIASNMINLCAHLRGYFLNRHRVYTRYCIVYAKNRPIDCVDLLPDYNAHYYTDMQAKSITTRSIEEAAKLLEIITPYIKGVYFINGGDNETSVIIRQIIVNISLTGKSVPNIIYTKDRYSYQLVAEPRTYIYRPKKYIGQDKSYVVDKSNLYKTYRSECKLKDIEVDGMALSNISARLFPVMLAIGGFPDRHIPNMFSNGEYVCAINSTRALKCIARAIYTNTIINDYNRIDDLYRIFGIPEALNQMFRKRLNCLDVIYQSYGVNYNFNPNPYIIDLFDPAGVRALNDQYFKDYPLDLNKL